MDDEITLLVRENYQSLRENGVPKVHIGVCAYNEEENITQLLENLLHQQGLTIDAKIIVICSGCTDATPRIVQQVSYKDKRVKYIVEENRGGKANALNKIFRETNNPNDLLVLVNADDLPETGSISKLLHPFHDKTVGATAGHPVPLNNSRSLADRIVQLIWDLHHQICMRGSVKMSGELCAIRPSLIEEIPENLATDEPYIEMLIRQQKYKVIYVPEAMVKMKGPNNLRELFYQRRRLCIGHQQIKSLTGFVVSTYDLKQTLITFLQSLTRNPTLNYLMTGLVGIVIESLARFTSLYHIKRGHIPFIWKRLGSTKKLGGD